MALSVTKFPPTITPAKNPAVFELTADVFEEGVNAGFFIQYPKDESIGALYHLMWDGGNKSTQLQCVLGPDQSGTQFPPRDREDLTTWLYKISGFIKRNTLLIEDFDLKVDEEGVSLAFTARKPGENYTITYNLYNCNAQIFIMSGSGGTEKTNLKIGLQVYRRIGNTDTLVAEDLCTPVISNWRAVVQIDISELLLPALSCAFSVQNLGYPLATLRNETALPYYICYYELYDSCTNVRVFTSRWFYSLNGGVPPWMHVDFFKSYPNISHYFTVTGRYFLTWHWFPKETDIYAPERLYLLVPFATNSTNISLRVTKHFYDDGDEIVYFNLITSLLTGQVFEIDVSYASLVGAYIENLVGYDVEIISQDSSFRSAVFNFTVDVRKLPNVRYFLFLNSLGAFECVRFTGETIHELGFQRDYYDQSSLTEYDEKLVPRSQLQPLTTRSFKVNTGWISKQAVDWMQDFLNSTQVFEIKDNKQYPVVIVQDKIELRRDSITLYSLTVSMEYADFPCVFQKEVDIPWEDVAVVEDPYLQD